VEMDLIGEWPPCQLRLVFLLSDGRARTLEDIRRDWALWNARACPCVGHLRAELRRLRERLRVDREAHGAGWRLQLSKAAGRSVYQVEQVVCDPPATRKRQVG